MFGPHNLAKNLTPTLLKTRKRFETMSAGSTTTDTEGGISPLWECEEVRDCRLCVIYGTFHVWNFVAPKFLLAFNLTDIFASSQNL